MKQTTKCNPELISLYMDHALKKDDALQFEAHLRSCKSCLAELKAYRSVSTLVKKGMEIRYEPNLEYQIIEKMRKRVHSTFRWMEFLIPATAMAILILIFSWINMTSTPDAPSAIVSYISGDISSVVIMETPKNRQTIVWIRENF